MVVALFLALLAAHCVADFPLQSDVIARNKGKVFFEAIGLHCLTAHAIIHAGLAGLVAALLGFPWVLPFLAVGVSHWLLDFCKSWRGFDTWHLTRGARACDRQVPRPRRRWEVLAGRLVGGNRQGGVGCLHARL